MKDEKQKAGRANIRTVKRPSPHNSDTRLGHVGQGVANIVIRVQVG